MASVHGREERAGNNYAKEDAPRPFLVVRTYKSGTEPKPLDLNRSGPEPKSYGKLRLYLTMFLCVLWLLAILRTCPIPVCVPEGPVTYLQDKRTSDLGHADPETGQQQEEEPDFCRQGCVKEDGEE
ncbi:hypothetical protein Bbelb_022410 [Branchiostoma belcheri]|nr:hypothetical protein Bbelb_022410 [Branchiostoma belcheri]